MPTLYSETSRVNKTGNIQAEEAFEADTDTDMHVQRPADDDISFSGKILLTLPLKSLYGKD